ncbi:MAG: recombination protein NinB [Betaproteobacteria bacterium]|nr:recombination protein NinB [Betaproteobacteria bacterium]
MERAIVLLDEARRARAVEAIAACRVGGATPLEVVIRPKRKPKTLDQLALYWVLCTEIGAAIGYAKDEMSEVFVEKYVPPIARVLPSGETVLVKKTPSKWSKAEASQIIDHMLRFAAEEGIETHHPGDLQ